MVNEPPKPGSREWDALVDENWVLSEEELGDLNSLVAQGTAETLSPTQERVADQLRKQSGMPLAPSPRGETVGRYFKLSEPAYEGLKHIAFSLGLERGGGNVTALLELIGQGKLHVSEREQ